MNWTPVLSFAVLWAAWLVCGSEKPQKQAERGNVRIRNMPLAHRGSTGRWASQMRRAEVSHKLVRPTGRHRQRPLVKRDSLEPNSPQADLVEHITHVQAKNRGNKVWSVQRLKPEMIKDEGTTTAFRSRIMRFPSGSSSPNILASFAGKNRVWVISAPHASDGYYRLMVSLLKNDVYCELAERHVQQIVMFHEEGEESGKVRKITPEGKILEQPLDPSLIPKLMNFLKLEKGKFGMVLLKKTLQIEETYPYPVRLEAIYEVIDQSPIRKIEKVRQKGFIQKCKAAGVEGQVSEEDNYGGSSTRTTPSGGHVQTSPKKEETKKGIIQPTRSKTVKKGLATTVPSSPAPTTRPTTFPPTTTTLRPITRIVTAASRPVTTTTIPVTQRTWTTKPHTLLPTLPETTTSRITDNLFSSVRKENRRERHPGHTERKPTATRRPSKAIHYDTYTESPTTAYEHYTRASVGRYRDNHTDRKDPHSRNPSVTSSQHNKPAKSKPPKKKAQDKILSNEYEDKYDSGQPAVPHVEEDVSLGNAPPKKGKVPKKHGHLAKSEKKKERAEKKNEKQSKKDKAEKKNKQEKERNKKNKKASKTENEGMLKPNAKSYTQPSRKSVATLLDFFEGKRRLLVSKLSRSLNVCLQASFLARPCI